MVKWPSILSRRRGPCLITAAALLCGVSAGRAQGNLTIPQFPSEAPFPPRVRKEPILLDRYPDKPSLPSAFTIPVGPLGFSSPGSFYLLRRQSLVSLDFLDENRLLFSFQVAGLMRRDAGDEAEARERQIRAVVVALPDGKIESETLWVVPDRTRYLWMLKDGHFLLRDSDGLEEGDAKLKIAPFLRLPGRLLWLEMDPAQQVMITNSLESAEAPQKPGEAGSPVTTQATVTADKEKPSAEATLAVRTLQRESGRLIRMTQVPWTSQTADWPINSDGYLESSRDNGGQWLLNLNYFAGGSRVVARVDSSCRPSADWVSEGELLAATCDPGGGGKLVAMSVSGARLWEVRTSSNTMWPLLTMAPDSSRLARETLVLKRPASRYKHLLGAGDLEGQMVRVMDAADGKVKFEAPLSPTLDGGGNVAISPSGRRVAILNAGAIQVFELIGPTRIPAASTDNSAH